MADHSAAHYVGRDMTFVLVFVFVFVFFGISLSQAQILIPERVEELNKQNISDFLIEMQDISSGKMANVPPEDLKIFLNDHLADYARIESVIRYEIPGHDAQDVEAYLNKDEYIKGVVNNQDAMRDYQTSVDIQKMDVAASGENAVVKTVIREQGNLPIEMGQEDGSSEVVVLPVNGVSECEQKLKLTRSRMVQLVWVDCETVITLSRSQEIANKEDARHLGREMDKGNGYGYERGRGHRKSGDNKGMPPAARSQTGGFGGAFMP